MLAYRCYCRVTFFVYKYVYIFFNYNLFLSSRRTIGPQGVHEVCWLFMVALSFFCSRKRHRGKKGEGRDMKKEKGKKRKERQRLFTLRSRFDLIVF